MLYAHCIAYRSGTLYIAKWPGLVSMFRGMSPGFGPSVVFLTEATSNAGRDCANAIEVARHAANAMSFIPILLEHPVLFLQVPQRGPNIRHCERDAELIFASRPNVEPMHLHAQTAAIGIVRDL